MADPDDIWQRGMKGDNVDDLWQEAANSSGGIEWGPNGCRDSLIWFAIFSVILLVLMLIGGG